MSVLDIAAHLSGSPSTATRPAFLTNFGAMHDAMRRDSARLIHAVARVESANHAAALRRWWTLFRQVIEHHHAREDDVAWPALRRRDPQFAAIELTLIGDHHALDVAMARVDRSLAALGDRGTDRHQSVIEATAAIVSFDALLNGHLTREEEATFPRIERFFTEAEWAELEEQFVRGISMRASAFVLPWVLDGADDWKTRSILAVVPVRITLLNRLLFTRSYRRVSAPLVAEAETKKMRAGGSVSIAVDVPAEQIYAVVSDITRTAEWSDECYRVVWTGSERGVGAGWKGWSRVGRVRWTRRGKIVEASPGRTFAYQTTPTFLKHDSTVWRFAIEPLGAACRLTQSYELTVLPYRLTAWLIARRVPHHLDRRPDMLDTVRRIKKIVETTSAPGPVG